MMEKDAIRIIQTIELLHKTKRNFEKKKISVEDFVDITRDEMGDCISETRPARYMEV